MSEKSQLDRVYHLILEQILETGQVPHYTEIAQKLSVTPEEGRQIVHALFNSGIPGWLYPGTDFIASFAPFNNQPTQFRISIDGRPQWFGQ